MSQRHRFCVESLRGCVGIVDAVRNNNVESVEGRGYGAGDRNIDRAGCGDGGDRGKFGRGGEGMGLKEWGKPDRGDVCGVSWGFCSAQRRDGGINGLEETKGKSAVRRE